MLSFFMAYGYVKIKRMEKENADKTPPNIGKKK
jgi:hypothetical protein